MAMPSAYTGNEKYIFISYAHKDSAAVFPIISRLAENGYRVWYDAGIDPGSEWDENIAGHIETCGYFIAFVSNNYLNSNNCKDELNFARDLEKERLIVYLEKVDLPSGMAMRMNRLQSIFKYTYPSEAEFYSKLFTAQNINLCHADGTAPQAEIPAEPTPNRANTGTGAGASTNAGTASQAWAQSFEQATDALKKTSAEAKKKTEEAFHKTSDAVNGVVNAAGGDSNCLGSFILGLLSVLGCFALIAPPIIAIILGRKGIDLGASPNRVKLAKWGIGLGWVALFMLGAGTLNALGVAIVSIVFAICFFKRKKKLQK